ncbi:Fe(3+) ABC transporter substrate-binding protein [[Bacillus thuringiensis] serovar konkukian]|nr:Fe(3+) ABC transporter substrate-binding protein [Bacillus thuringiensis]MED1304279.1 Fe(3+) ABC transporter substrate-binding protein [Bacillus pacificus]OUB07943.1 Fe(3+) ABC transporter substrate-binding protein [[Bacillus thuringiensis] serovar konkukian]
MKKLLSVSLAAVMAMGVLAGCTSNKDDGAAATKDEKKEDKVVNVYTARHYPSDEAVFDAFTADTGIKVNLVKATAEELFERMKREGENTEADIFMTVDGGVLNTAKTSDLLQPIESKEIDANVPKNLRDKDNHWVGLSTRARVLVYPKDRVKSEQLSTYEDLATDKWKGKVAARSSTNLYNQSLLASFIALDGEEKAEAWAKGITTNLVQNPPEGGDRDQAKKVVAGQGDVAIMNSYYVGQLANSENPEEVKVAEKLGVFFPNQETTGTHVNISGMGLAKHSKNKDNAVKLIEYFTGEKAQTQLISKSFEFPVNSKAQLPELLKSWGTFKTQEIDFAVLGENNVKATQIFNKVGWK